MYTYKIFEDGGVHILDDKSVCLECNASKLLNFQENIEQSMQCLSSEIGYKLENDHKDATSFAYIASLAIIALYSMYSTYECERNASINIV